MLSLTSPRHTPAHDWRAGAKLGGLAALTLVLFWPQSGGLALALALGLLLAEVALARHWGLWPVWIRLFRPLWPFALLLAIWHLTLADPFEGLVIVLRLTAALGAANLVTMTTRLSDMQALFAWLARPLAPILPHKALSLAMALMIRFVPVMTTRAGQLAQAWSARSPRRPRARLLAPLVLSALDDADRVAEALRARGGAG